MGAVVDTTVFIDLERSNSREGHARAAELVGQHLTECLGPDEEAAIAAITASELLHGVHRASAKYRATREAFVESILAIVPVLDFDLLAARAHARLWADLANTGSDVGPHDRIVAATAISLGWRVATGNVRHFERIAGLDVVEVR
ncbi:MAG: PIN domain-containing protein [Actinomycetota bacterium]|nr:PIN domain-containing protein [Actinomycetota bacterium]